MCIKYNKKFLKSNIIKHTKIKFWRKLNNHTQIHTEKLQLKILWRRGSSRNHCGTTRVKWIQSPHQLEAIIPPLMLALGPKKCAWQFYRLGHQASKQSTV